MRTRVCVCVCVCALTLSPPTHREEGAETSAQNQGDTSAIIQNDTSAGGRESERGEKAEEESHVTRVPSIPEVKKRVRKIPAVTPDGRPVCQICERKFNSADHLKR